MYYCEFIRLCVLCICFIHSYEYISLCIMYVLDGRPLVRFPQASLEAQTQSVGGFGRGWLPPNRLSDLAVWCNAVWWPKRGHQQIIWTSSKTILFSRCTRGYKISKQTECCDFFRATGAVLFSHFTVSWAARYYNQHNTSI